MAVTSLFPIGGMKQQHAVNLESTWETGLIITRFPAQRTGLLTPLLTCLTFYFTLLLPFTWTNYSKSNSLSPFFFLDKNFLSPIHLLSFLLDKNIISPTSTLQKYSKTIPNSVLAAISFPLRKIILRQFQILS